MRGVFVKRFASPIVVAEAWGRGQRMFQSSKHELPEIGKAALQAGSRDRCGCDRGTLHVGLAGDGKCCSRAPSGAARVVWTTLTVSPSCPMAGWRWRSPGAQATCVQPGPVRRVECAGHRDYARNGHETALATGLPSLGGPFENFGLGGLTMQNGKLYSIVQNNPQAFGNPADDICKGAPDVNSCVATMTAVVNDVGDLNELKSLRSNRGWRTSAGRPLRFQLRSCSSGSRQPGVRPGRCRSLRADRGAIRRVLRHRRRFQHARLRQPPR